MVDEETYCFEDDEGKPITERMFGPDYYRNFGRAITHNPWLCSYCFRILKSKSGLKKHVEKCFPQFRDSNFIIISEGIIPINKYSDERLLKIIDNLGYISKLEQRLDFEPMTCINAIKRMDKRVLCKIINGRLVGYITFCKRRREWSVEDFFVVKHMRNRGIGTELLQKMLKYTGETRYTIIYNKPNEKMIKFLKDIGTDPNKIKIW